jgi:3-oxoacyl-[acyl-carrier-protein] synthase-1
MKEASNCRLRALGMVSPLGSRHGQIWPRLVGGDQSRLRFRDDIVPGRRLLLGQILDEIAAVPRSLAHYACRNNALSLTALDRMRDEVEDVVGQVGRERVGAVIGTSTSGVSDAENALRYQREHARLAPEFAYAQLEFGGAAGFVAELLGLSGPAYTISTACSSGARALATARSLLRLGVCDAVIAGATDSLCNLTIFGFSALQAIADEVTNPCSVHRKGLTLGEGSALFLVTRESGGIQLLGVGESSEAHHMSAPDPSGAGAESAMRGALVDAGVGAEDILYVNLHGTGTPLNDAMECAAVWRVFGARTPCSSTKPLVGHTLGAAGAIEAGFCWLMLNAIEIGMLPLIPHCWDGARDPALAAIHLVAPGESAAAGTRPLVMSNSFGFGGNNCTLILGRESW